MNREYLMRRVAEKTTTWDILIIGGGATGLGVAVDAAARGLSTLLVEKSDFASGTSSKSTKLIHGGIRYLKTFEPAHLMESAQEQRIISSIAPHLVKEISFLIPVKSMLERYWYGIGLFLFDLVTWKNKHVRASFISKESLSQSIPNINTDNFIGAISYADVQFNDSKYAIALAKTASDLGATTLNYCSVESLLKAGDKIAGAKVRDQETGNEFDVYAKTVINACGANIDYMCSMDDATHIKRIQALKGSHIILPGKFLGGDKAIIIPETKKGKVLYLIPWLGNTLIGTTEDLLPDANADSIVTDWEIDYLLSESCNYLKEKPTREDIIGTFSGIRPLLTPDKKSTKKSITRDFSVTVSNSGLLTIGGGKWTTYRKMAEVALAAVLDKYTHAVQGSVTDTIKLKNSTTEIKALEESCHELAKLIHPELAITWADIYYAVHNEYALTLMDILDRRTQCIYKNPAACLQAAPVIAGFMEKELGKNPGWSKNALQEFLKEMKKKEVSSLKPLL